MISYSFHHRFPHLEKIIISKVGLCITCLGCVWPIIWLFRMIPGINELKLRSWNRWPNQIIISNFISHCSCLGFFFSSKLSNANNEHGSIIYPNSCSKRTFNLTLSLFSVLRKSNFSKYESYITLLGIVCPIIWRFQIISGINKRKLRS